MSVHLSYDSLLRNSDMPGGATALTAQVDNNRLIGRREAIQKNANLVEIGNDRGSGGGNRR